jgi:hypothetical protein
MGKLKYLYVQLKVQDGEREHTHRCLTTTYADNLDFVAQKYAASYWGEVAWRDGNHWYAHGGEIAITLEKWRELTPEQYQFLTQLFVF